MALDVDLDELIREAARLVVLAQQTGAAIPRGWVPPAGADPISASTVPRLNAQTASVFNQAIDVLNDIARTAHHVGASAVDYSTADDHAGRVIGGAGREILSNPAASVEQFAPRMPPVISGAPGGSIDPLTFAKQLRAGPGPSAPTGFADGIRRFMGESYADVLDGVDRSVLAMQNWRPVGASAAAELTRHRGTLNDVADDLRALTDRIDTYSNAFRTAKAKHPSPEEIQAARKELLAAMRSKNEARIQAALARFEEQNARSAETVTSYEVEVDAKERGIDPKDPGKEPPKETPGGGGSNDSGANDAAMSAMMPALMNAMQMANSALNQPNSEFDEWSDEEYLEDEFGYPGIPSPGGGGSGSYGGGGGGGAGGSLSSYPVAQLPMVSAPNGPTAAALPRAAVIEPLAASGAGAAGARGAAGMPMMPYMPMAPGAGGAGGGTGDRNRVVAWHPDRLMYVDDTPHTEGVIGERPTIAPTVTPPTPTPAQQNSSQSGGSA
ncbi:PPE domain-containing protein [Nocardia sp. NPDC050710]|uniref:PPE domain-containing protein n=1 Tax=Nocardia sp. NPDC050710 TaxID=3157220 RepID=UPI0033CAD5AA